MSEEIRLQKFLSENEICSRRKAEAYILDGKVKVNGKVITKLGTKVDPDKDEVIFDNKKIIKKQEKKVYILLNKPIGYITTTKDQFRKRYSFRFSKNKRKSITCW